MSDDEQITALRDAITENADGDMVTKFIVVAETINETGARQLETFAPTDIPTWDVLGMVRYAQVWAEWHATREQTD